MGPNDAESWTDGSDASDAAVSCQRLVFETRGRGLASERWSKIGNKSFFGGSGSVTLYFLNECMYMRVIVYFMI